MRRLLNCALPLRDFRSLMSLQSDETTSLRATKRRYLRATSQVVGPRKRIAPTSDKQKSEVAAANQTSFTGMRNLRMKGLLKHCIKERVNGVFACLNSVLRDA